MIQFDDELTAHDAADVWGVTPESITLGLVQGLGRGDDEDDDRDGPGVRNTDGDDATGDALRRYYDLTVLRTNYDPGWEPFRSGIERVCRAWFPPPVATAATVVDVASLPAFVAGAAIFDTPSGVARLLVHGQEALARADPADQVTMSRGDVHGYVDAESERRLLRSLRVIAPGRSGESYRLNRSVFEPLAEGFAGDRAEAAYAIVARTLTHLGVDDPASLADPVLAACGVDPPASPSDTADGALSVYVRDNNLKSVVDTLFGDELSTVLASIRSRTAARRDRLLETLQFPPSASATAAVETVSWPFSPPVAGVCALASRRSIPIAAGWLADRVGGTELGVHDALTDAGIDVTYEEGLLRFRTAYASPTDAVPATTAYTEWVHDRLRTLRTRERAIAAVDGTSRDLRARQRHRLLASTLEFLESFTVAPTRFVYTIFDPVFHADAYSVDQYVGDSPELEREVRTIRRWRQDRPHDAATFAELIPAVLNHPLEAPDAAPIVRMMTPWTNFAIQDYVSQLTRLFDNDVEVRLLVRLPEPRQWTQLRNNLLSRVGDTDGNLELRSYTRYKQYRDHTELRDIDQDRIPGETGVHAKLFVAGDPDDGVVLAGSANLMENSLFYNPEAGLQTRNPHAVETAINYFDLVWELAAPDRIPQEAFTGSTERTYFPDVYRPR